ncbi:MAG: cyclic nucleotide-binding domain-containing protein [Verrucomicrobiota bacterium]|nr:cyclic nucleotide-binding domain-containing protein [Verrucomicrobiota bacterium]
MVWQTSILVKGLTPEDLSIVRKCMVEKPIEIDEYLIREGDTGSDLFFIESGAFEVLKNDWVADQRYRLTILKPGEVTGEMALFGDNQRFASVRAIEPSKVWVLLLDKLVKLSPEVASKITKNLGSLLASRLSATNQTVVGALKREIWQAKKRSAMSGIAVKVICAIVLYQVIVQLIMPYVGPGHFSLISPFFVVSGGWLCYRLLRQNDYPLKMYAVTTRNWRRALWESVLFTIPFLVGIFLVKLRLFDVAMKGAHISFFKEAIGSISPFLTSWVILTNILFSPIQEFIFRGVIQFTLHRFLMVRHRALVSILLTNLIYVQTHFYWNFSPLLLIPGIFWSWMVIRHRTLIGVSVSHMMMVAWLYFMIEIPTA